MNGKRWTGDPVIRIPGLKEDDSEPKYSWYLRLWWWLQNLWWKIEDIVKAAVIVSITSSIIAIIVVEFVAESCNWKTRDMGYPTRLSGPTCQIEVEPGKWIPVNTYRYEAR